MSLPHHAILPKDEIMNDSLSLAEKQTIAEDWFRSLRDSICQAFETLETEAFVHEKAHRCCGSCSKTGEEKCASTPAQFTRTPWQRDDQMGGMSAGSGGEISLMKGRVFEKVGVNISTVQGVFSDAFRSEIPGADKHPEYWASGISLVAHAANPRAPSAHMNTRMIVTGGGARIWFGGGGDLNPAIAYAEDTRAFHDAFKTVCDPVDSEYYRLFSDWCDAYFTLPHRNMTRGVGGIFYDYLGVNQLGSDTTPISGGRFGKGGLNDTRVARGMEKAANASLSWQEALDYTKSVGETFRDSYSALVRGRMFTPHTPEDRHTQLVYRGRYAEYNLLYDRGTRFGLMTGGNTDAILMSLPPLAVWE